MTTSTKSQIRWTPNLTNMVLSAVLWFLYASGLTSINPDQTATDITNAILQEAWPLLLMIAWNLGTTIYYWVKTWKTDKPNFLGFLTSVNFWLVLFNIGGAIAAMYGIYIPEDAGQRIATFIQQKDFVNLGLWVAINIILPVFKKITDNKTEKGQAKLAAAGKVF